MQTLRYFFFQGAFLAAAWFATVEEHIGVGRVLIAYTWLMFVLTGLVMVAAASLPDDQKHKAHLKTSHTPAWIRTPVFIAQSGILVWHGWWWTAIAWSMAMFFCVLLREKPKAV